MINIVCELHVPVFKQYKTAKFFAGSLRLSIIIMLFINSDFLLYVKKGLIDIQLTAIGFNKKQISFEVYSDTNMLSEMSLSDDLLDEIVISGTLTEISKRDSPIAI